MTDLLYTSHPKSRSNGNVSIVLALFSSIASHARWLNSRKALLRKLQRACSVLKLSDPPVVHFENESHQHYLNFLKTLISDLPALSYDMDIESHLVGLCLEVLQIYLGCTTTATSQAEPADPLPTVHWILPLEAVVKEELAARTPLLMSALQVFTGFERETFRRHVSRFFPLLVDLLRSEHSSGEVQLILTSIFDSCIGPLIMG